MGVKGKGALGGFVGAGLGLGLGLAAVAAALICCIFWMICSKLVTGVGLGSAHQNKIVTAYLSCSHDDNNDDENNTTKLLKITSYGRLRLSGVRSKP